MDLVAVITGLAVAVSVAAVPVANFETSFVRATVSVEKLVAEIDKKQIFLGACAGGV